MTTVAAVTNGLSVWMAADGIAVDEANRRWPEPHKIARLPVFTEAASRQGERAEALIGIGGAIALVALVQHELTLEQAPARGDDRDLYMWAHSVARAITGLALELRPPITDAEGHLDGLGLLGFAGRLWSLTENAATPLPPAWAIGTGGEYALGAVHAQMVAAPERAPEDVLRTALATAIVHDGSSGHPVHVERVDTPYASGLRRLGDDPTLPLPKAERVIVLPQSSRSAAATIDSRDQT